MEEEYKAWFEEHKRKWGVAMVVGQRGPIYYGRRDLADWLEKGKRKSHKKSLQPGKRE